MAEKKKTTSKKEETKKTPPKKADKCTAKPYLTTLESQPVETGVIALDLVLGGNLPKGKIIELNGESMAGKTTLALYVASKVVKQGRKVLYIDIERGITDDLLDTMGLTPYKDKLFFLDQEISLFSEFQAKTDEVLGKGKDRKQLPKVTEETPDLIILDSLGCLQPDASKEKDIESNVSNNMLMSRYTKQMFKDLIPDVDASKVTFIFINHLTTVFQKVGFGMQIAKQESAGASMVKYGPDIRLMMTVKKKLTKNRETAVGIQESKYGSEIEIYAKKSRLADNEIRMPMMVIDGMGVFNGYTLFFICKAQGWIIQNGAYFNITAPLVDKEITLHGTKNLYPWLQQNCGNIVAVLKKEGKYRLTYDKANFKTMSDMVGS